MAKVQKSFLILAEDTLSAVTVETLIDMGDNKVYMVDAGSYQNISSMIRTYQITCPGEFDYIAVFNANSDDEVEREEKIAMVKNLSYAEKSPENIGIFCFRNNIETELHLPQLNDSNISEITDCLKRNAEEMKQSPTIIEIQKFVDTIIKKKQIKHETDMEGQTEIENRA